MTYAARSLKVAVLREEFVALTGDAFQAIVLNQFIYWVQKVNDFDDFIREEQERNPDCNVFLRHGWIYKKAQDLIEETMLRMSENTMRRILKTLIEKGWVEERTNPDNRWNKVLQYRPDLKKIQQDLYVLGYALPGFPLLQPAENPNRHFDASKRQFEASNLQTERFILKDSEITPKITAKKSADTREEVSKSMMEIWNRLLQPSAPLALTEERSSRFTPLLRDFFQGKIDLWEQFCQEITQSSFLMGKGQRGWKVTLDWILEAHNLQKVLEGNYRDAVPQNHPELAPSPEECDFKAKDYIAHIIQPDLRRFSEGLKEKLGATTFLSWFTDIDLSFNAPFKVLTLNFPTKFKKQYVDTHFKEKILSAARLIFPASDFQWIECGVLSPSLEKASSNSEFVSNFKVFPGDKSESCPHEARTSCLTFPTAVQTREEAAPTQTTRPTSFSKDCRPSLSHDVPPDEPQTFSPPDNTDVGVTGDREQPVLNACFFSEEESAPPAPSLLPYEQEQGALSVVQEGSLPDNFEIERLREKRIVFQGIVPPSLLQEQDTASELAWLPSLKCVPSSFSSSSSLTQRSAL